MTSSLVTQSWLLDSLSNDDGDGQKQQLETNPENQGFLTKFAYILNGLFE